MTNAGVVRMGVVGLGGWAAVACNLSMTPPDEAGWDEGQGQAWTEEVPWVEETPLPVEDVRLTGQVGEVGALETQPTRVSAYEAPGQSANVQLYGSSAEGAAMAAIVVFPGMDAAALVPGARFHVDAATWAEGTDESPRFDVIGCSGPREGEWDFDEAPEDVDVTITDDDGDDCIELTFTATFTDQRDPVIGHFEVSRTHP